MIRQVGVAMAGLACITLASLATAGDRSSTLNEAETKQALMVARVKAAECSRVSGVRGSGKLRVSIGNNGQVTEILMLSVPPGMDEKTDACVRAEFNKIRVTPFEGDAANVTGAFVLM